MSDKNVGLFEREPGSPKLPPARELKKLVAMQLTGLEANKGMYHVPTVDYALPGMMSLFEIDDHDRVNRAVVVVGLALQLYFREHGRFPAALPELAHARYLKSLPLDPYGQGETIHYRLDGNFTDRAVLWSVGLDGINRAGKLSATEPETRESTNAVFEIRAVQKSQSGK
jgi:hypothetical protein